MPELIAPTAVQVGDVIEATLMGWGSKRGTFEVVGTVGDSDGKRSEENQPVFALGKAMGIIKDGRYTIVKDGDVTPLYWPSGAQWEQDVVNEGTERGVKYSPVLIARKLVDVGDDDPLAELRAQLGTAGPQVTLRNPEVMCLHAGMHSMSCDAGGCDIIRAKWYYPKTRNARCALHRDKSLQNASDPSHMHETYIAWSDDPMDARHFA